MSNLSSNNKASCNFDKAIFLACKTFDEKHPKEKQPTWLKYCIAIRGNINENNNWIIKMVLQHKYELEPNQYYEWTDEGVPILIEVNVVTGEKSVVICCGAPIEEVFFEVEVDFKNGLVTINQDIDLEMLEGNKYKLNIL